MSLTQSGNERLTVAASFRWVFRIEKDGRKMFTNDGSGEGGGESVMRQSESDVFSKQQLKKCEQRGKGT